MTPPPPASVAVDSPRSPPDIMPGSPSIGPLVGRPSPFAAAAAPRPPSPSAPRDASDDEDVVVRVTTPADLARGAPPTAAAAVVSASLRFARLKNYFYRGNAVILGDARDAGLATLAAAVGATEAPGSGRLHVLVRLRDVDAVAAATRDGRAVRFGRSESGTSLALPGVIADGDVDGDADTSLMTRPSHRSALTAALGGAVRLPRPPPATPLHHPACARRRAHTPSRLPLPACDCSCADCAAAAASRGPATVDTPPRALVVRAVVDDTPPRVPSPAAPPTSLADDQEPVLHLVVRRGGRLALARAPEGGFELSVCSTLGGSARALAAAAAAAAGESPAALSRHRLLLDGCELPPDEPLASAGVKPGAVLELVPADAAPAAAGSSAAATFAEWGARSAARPVPSPSSTTAPDLPPASAPARFPAGTSPSLVSPSLASPLHSLHANFLAARAGLASGRPPELAPAGSGGSYFLRDAQGSITAVFKPADEEPDSACNPRTLVGGRAGSGGASSGASSSSASRGRGVLPGEGAAREVAAYVIDAGFAGVPPTALVDCDQIVAQEVGSVDARPHRAVVARRRGALQKFVVSTSDAEETGPAAFALRDVHRIAALDIRLLNTDRNGGNILVAERERDGDDAAARTHTGARSPFRLVPIDHAFTLPSSLAFAGDATLEWRYWPQAKQPVDAATAALISSFDPHADTAACAAAGVPLTKGASLSLALGTAMLQAAVAAGAPPADWADAVVRPDDGERSPLERLAAAARARARAAAGPGGRVDDRALVAEFRGLAAEYFGRQK